MNIVALARINAWHGVHGGMEVHGRLLSEGLVHRGHQVSLICTAHPSGHRYDEKCGVRIFYLGEVPYGTRRKRWSSASVAKVMELHRQRESDIIWSQSFDGFGLVQHRRFLKSVPLVLTAHGCIQQELISALANRRIIFRRPSKLLRSVFGLFYSYYITQKPLLRAATTIFTVSPQVRDDLIKWYGRSLSGKCMTVPNGIDTDRFHPDFNDYKRVRNAHGVLKGETLLLTLGRLTHEKGHHLALASLKRLLGQQKKVKLLIVGEGNYRSRLQAQTQQLGLEDFVRFAGKVPNDKVVQFYNAADIVLMPTLTVEGLPFVLLEAMACQKPVIASRIGGNTFIIENGRNGILIERGSRQRLTEAITDLIENSQQRNEIGRLARKTVISSFSKDRMVDRIEEQMQRIACGRKK